MSGLTLAQHRLIDGCAIGSAVLSLTGSMLILWHIKLKKGIRERLLCGLSTADALASLKIIVFALFFHQVDRQPGVDCSIEGFLRVWLDNAAPLYNASLSLYFVLVVRYHCRDESLSRAEWFLHTFPVFYPLAFAVAGLALHVFAPVDGFTVCGPDAYPRECKDDISIPCENGTDHYQLIFVPTTVFAPVFTFAVLFVGSVLMLHAVWKSDNPDESYRHTRRVAGQSLQWVMCFVVTYIFGLVLIGVQTFDAGFSHEKYFWLSVICQTFLPLQGLADAMVFFRPRYLMFRRNAGASRVRSLKSTLFTRSKAPTRPSMIGTSRRFSTLPSFVRKAVDVNADKTNSSRSSDTDLKATYVQPTKETSNDTENTDDDNAETVVNGEGSNEAAQ